MPDKVMMAVDTPDAVRQTELIVLGQMRDTMQAMTQEITGFRGKLGQVGEDVAAIKIQVAATAKLEQRVEELNDEIDLMKLRNAKQDGAAALFQWLKDYGGWLAGLGGLAYGLFLHH